jgi:hypothetical protein
MALPTNLAAKIKSIPMDPSVLATNPELAYLLSFASHRTRLSTQLSLTILYTSILEIHTNLLSSTINSPISTKVLTITLLRRLLKTPNLKASKSSKESDVASKSSMPELPQIYTIWLLSICLERVLRAKRSSLLPRKTRKNIGSKSSRQITLLNGLKLQKNLLKI